MSIDNLYNEQELLGRIAEGDEQAFARFYAHYYNLLQPFIIKNSSSSQAARDILQMTFLRVWLNRHKLEKIQNVKPWMIKIASREYLTYIRDNLSKQLRSLEIDETEKNLAGQRASETEYNFALKEIKNLVAEAVERLSSQRRQVFQLSRGEELSIREIADRLRLAPKTVKNTLTAALKEIRDYLHLHGYEFVILCIFLLF